MFSYHCLNPIAEVGLDQFTTDYKKWIHQRSRSNFSPSAAMHDMTFSNRLEAIARAGAGGEQYSTGALQKKVLLF